MITHEDQSTDLGLLQQLSYQYISVFVYSQNSDKNESVLEFAQFASTIPTRRRSQQCACCAEKQRLSARKS